MELSALLGTIGGILEAAVGWVGTVVETIASTPILLIPFGIGIAGSAIGLYHSLRG